MVKEVVKNQLGVKFDQDPAVKFYFTSTFKGQTRYSNDSAKYFIIQNEIFSNQLQRNDEDKIRSDAKKKEEVFQLQKIGFQVDKCQAIIRSGNPFCLYLSFFLHL